MLYSTGKGGIVDNRQPSTSSHRFALEEISQLRGCSDGAIANPAGTNTLTDYTRFDLGALQRPDAGGEARSAISGRPVPFPLAGSRRIIWKATRAAHGRFDR